MVFFIIFTRLLDSVLFLYIDQVLLVFFRLLLNSAPIVWVTI